MHMKKHWHWYLLGYFVLAFLIKIYPFNPSGPLATGGSFTNFTG